MNHQDTKNTKVSPFVSGATVLLLLVPGCIAHGDAIAMVSYRPVHFQKAPPIEFVCRGISHKDRDVLKEIRFAKPVDLSTHDVADLGQIEVDFLEQQQ